MKRSRFLVIPIALCFSAPLQASAVIGGTVNTTTAVPPLGPLTVRSQPKPTASVWTTLAHDADVSLTETCRRYNAAYSAVLNTYNLHNLSKTQSQA